MAARHQRHTDRQTSRPQRTMLIC